MRLIDIRMLYRYFLKFNAKYEIRQNDVWRVGGRPSPGCWSIPYKTYLTSVKPYIINKG